MKSALYLLVAALLVAILYLIYEIWHVFGAWPMILSILVNAFVGGTLTYLIGCKTKTIDGYVFNPKELPKYLSMVVTSAVGLYLYTQLDNPQLSDKERIFGLIWIVLVVALPITLEVYKLFRDRNDYVKISGSLLTYRDNDDLGELSLHEVKRAESLNGDVKLEMLDGSSRLIKTSQMNFRGMDLLQLVNTINEILN